MKERELQLMAQANGFDVVELGLYQELATSQKLQVWSHVRNFPEGASLQGQGLKLAEECGEIFEALCDFDHGKFIDAIGDCIVVIGIIAHIKDYDVDLLTKDRGCPEYWLHAVPFDNHPASPCFVVAAFRLQHALGEVCQAIAKGKGLIVPINNFMKHLCELTHMVGENPYFCFNAAFSEIENRRGRMEAGVFIKEEDLK